MMRNFNTFRDANQQTSDTITQTTPDYTPSTAQHTDTICMMFHLATWAHAYIALCPGSLQPLITTKSVTMTICPCHPSSCRRKSRAIYNRNRLRHSAAQLNVVVYSPLWGGARWLKRKSVLLLQSCSDIFLCLCVCARV